MNWRPKGQVQTRVLPRTRDEGGTRVMETQLKIMAWNVAQNARALSITPAVRDGDIYLLNEAPPALELGDLLMKADDRTIALDCPHPDGLCACNRRWSAAVAVPPRHGIERIKDARRSESGRVLRFEPSRKGSWIAAIVSLEGGEHVTAISLYGLRGGERSDESVHRSLSELSPVFDHERYGRLLVLGGDLNTLVRRIGSSLTMGEELAH